MAFEEVDLVVVGAGPVGAVVAERAASQLGWRVLVLERRGHVAGNCHDRVHPSGVLVHQYGPHYFRTNSDAVLAYLSKFTEWIPGNYVVKSSVGGELFPFPINLLTLAQFFKTPPLTPEQGEALLASKRLPIGDPQNSEEAVLAKVGRELYEAFYLGYTLKQWGRHPRELDPSVCGRIPVRLNQDVRYVDHKHQVTPKDGFTRLFGRMLEHPLIRVELGADYLQLRGQLRPRKATVFCGPVDEYFDRKLGPLPWRSLEFDFKVFDEPLRQPCVQINYPNDHAFTRSVEIKHVTGQQHPRTVISYETSSAVGDPYYPIPAAENARLYQRYEALAEEETRHHRVFFSGRLARYRYINTDEAVEMALGTFEQLRRLA